MPLHASMSALMLHGALMSTAFEDVPSMDFSVIPVAALGGSDEWETFTTDSRWYFVHVVNSNEDPNDGAHHRPHRRILEPLPQHARRSASEEEAFEERERESERQR